MFTACGYLHSWGVQLCLPRNICPAHFTTGWDIFSPHTFLSYSLITIYRSEFTNSHWRMFSISSNVYATFARHFVFICVLSSFHRWLSFLKQLVVLLPCLHLYREALWLSVVHNFKAIHSIFHSFAPISVLHSLNLLLCFRHFGLFATELLCHAICLLLFFGLVSVCFRSDVLRGYWLIHR